MKFFNIYCSSSPIAMLVRVLSIIVLTVPVLSSCSNSDDPDFEFVVDLTGEKVQCSWLTSKNQDKRIQKYCGRGHIKGACQESCNFCSCVDDPTFMFMLENNKRQPCSWILLKNTEDRRENYCYKNKNVAAGIASDIGNKCVNACGFCSGGAPPTTSTKSPVSAPSPTSSTKAPTFTTTDSPTKAPVFAPSSCSDDANFRFILDDASKDNKEQGCEWLTRNQDPEKLEKRISTYCPRGHIKGACQASCDFCPCVDKAGYKFSRPDNGLKKKTCNWIAGAPHRRRFCFEDEDTEGGVTSDVGDNCPASCGFCRRTSRRLLY